MASDTMKMQIYNIFCFISNLTPLICYELEYFFYYIVLEDSRSKYKINRKYLKSLQQT